jgi:hypothetical protein
MVASFANSNSGHTHLLFTEAELTPGQTFLFSNSDYASDSTRSAGTKRCHSHSLIVPQLVNKSQPTIYYEFIILLTKACTVSEQDYIFVCQLRVGSYFRTYPCGGGIEYLHRSPCES